MVWADLTKLSTMSGDAAKVKHDWYQTDTSVVIEVRIKGADKDKVKCDFSPASLSLSAPIPGGEAGAEFSLELDLCHRVVPEECAVRVMGTKIEVRLRKADGVRWAALEGDGADPAAMPATVSAGAAAASSSSSASYPSSSGKDWNKIGAEIDRDFEEDKPEGEAALNQMFQKIYADADDDTKRAMNKSFQESGGTCLSTNWKDIKKGPVEVKPPDGMEFKKWDS